MFGLRTDGMGGKKEFQYNATITAGLKRLMSYVGPYLKKNQVFKSGQLLLVTKKNNPVLRFELTSYLLLHTVPKTICICQSLHVFLMVFNNLRDWGVVGVLYCFRISPCATNTTLQ